VEAGSRNPLLNFGPSRISETAEAKDFACMWRPGCPNENYAKVGHTGSGRGHMTNFQILGPPVSQERLQLQSPARASYAAFAKLLWLVVNNNNTTVFRLHLELKRLGKIKFCIISISDITKKGKFSRQGDVVCGPT